MKTLSISTQGVHGKQFKTEKRGLIRVYQDNSRMLNIDNFYGHGNNYLQRPEPIITIFDGLNPPNESVVFEGTLSKLVELLSKK
jgi:hypothetical protein